MNLSAAQIQAYAAAAGFSGADMATAVAVALAESSGNPGAIGDAGNSFGLWQINLPNHPEFAGADLTDPQTNANAAFQVYSAARGFRPWTTFKTGAYQAYMPSMTLPATAVTSAFAPNTGVMTLLPSISPGNSAPPFDFATIGIALALILGVGYALSEG